MGQSRATQRYLPQLRDDETPLTKRIIELTVVYGRYGTPRITSILRAEGWTVNDKRVERIWRREGLKVPQKQPQRGRLWQNDGSCIRLRPAHQNHVWAYDFVHEYTHDGRPFRMLTSVDEYTRECLAIDVARRMKSDDVLERLAWLFANRGAALERFRRLGSGGKESRLAANPGISSVYDDKHLHLHYPSETDLSGPCDHDRAEQRHSAKRA